MIFVRASAADEPVVHEFFELFKTPWQFHSADSPANVLLCNGSEIPVNTAGLVVVFNGGNEAGSRSAIFQHEQIELPIYGPRLVDPVTQKIAFQRVREGGKTVVRIGFDLFAEIRHLLTIGQPENFSAVPALELHIAFLRNLILNHGFSLVEIPPQPAGHGFIVCLTHDVDHVGIRNHKFDHTMFGFLKRATLGSMLDVLSGKKAFPQLVKNWLAVLKLPFIHLGLADDFWYQFDGYVALEDGAPSTFFVIPKKGEAGLDPEGRCRASRAASYNAGDLKDILRGLEKRGKEIGVHGIDAWRDAASGCDEKKIVSGITGVVELGVRMHWLYFNTQSHVQLEQAGFAYDSTCGYNGTVGYRAGTTQVFKPLAVRNLLELPMHIMDTALFYPSYLNLSPQQADEKIRPLIANAARFGGALTVNWHDRSIAPERLWDGSYVQLISHCKKKGAWFATAGQAVQWFRQRREANFEAGAHGVRIRAANCGANELPGQRVRVHQPGGKFSDRELRDGLEILN